MIPAQALLEALVAEQGLVGVHLRGGQTLRGRLRALDASWLLLEGQGWHLVDRGQIAGFDLHDTPRLRDLLLEGADELQTETPPTGLALKRRVAALSQVALEVDWSQWAAPAERLAVGKVVEALESAVKSITAEFGQAALSQVPQVRLLPADAASVSHRDGAVVLGVAARQGRPGRPARSAIQAALEAVL